MLKKIKFSKMVASGNDFVVVDSLSGKLNLKKIAIAICNRKFGIGADGLLVLEKSKVANVKMRIFNADGSEAEMCGNGARCTAYYIGKNKPDLETKAGIIQSFVGKSSVRIRLTDPKDLKLDIPLVLRSRNLRVNFINTGVPHTVIFVNDIDNINVASIGRDVRFHKEFSPLGTNVNFVEVLNKNSIRVRTYERGVEDETLACGTGSSASALIFALKTGYLGSINVHTQSKEILKVYFKRKENIIFDTWLEGKAKIVYKGEYYV